MLKPFIFDKPNRLRWLQLACIWLFTPNLAWTQCSSTISTYPYQQDFEMNDGGWVSAGTGNDWAWGSPSKPVISNAGSGLKCWICGGLSVSSYNGSERSYVESPCFDFSAIQNPFFSCRIFWETEKQYDGANLQYSLNGGNTWSNAGSQNDATNCLNANWFNYGSITNLASLATTKEGWSGNIQPTSGNCLGGLGSNGWVTIKHTMPYLAGEPQVMFRFTFGSGTTCNAYDGFAFDSIVIMEAPVAPVLTYQSTPAGCTVLSGSLAVTLSGGSGPFAYAWQPPVSTNLLASGLASGNYQLHVTDGFGCTSSLQMQVPASPAVTATVISQTDTCAGGKGSAAVVASAGTAPYTYLWSSGNTNDQLTMTGTGSYIVTVTDAAGCTDEETVFIADTGAFTFSLGPDKVVCGNQPVFLAPGSFASYTWQDGSQQPVYPADQPGTYSVVVENDLGCSATDSVSVTENCLNDVLLPNAFTPNGDGYNDVLQATGNDVTSFFIQIRNRWGQLIFQSRDMQYGWDGRVQNKPAQEGIYIWKIYFTIGSKQSVEKTGSVYLIR